MRRRFFWMLLASHLAALCAGIVLLLLHGWRVPWGLWVPIGLTVAGTLAFLLARRLASVLEVAKGTLLDFASGRTERRPPLEEPDGIPGDLEEFKNALEEKLAIRLRERVDIEAVLESMGEPVVVIDRDRRVLTANPAAESVLGLDDRVRRVGEGVTGDVLVGLAAEVFVLEKPRTAEWSPDESRSAIYSVYAAPVRIGDGVPDRVVMIFHEVTQLRRLEQVRAEFVANASHELKTPLTSIIGFLETLEDGAIDDPEAARGFIKIVARNARGLGNILDDLLKLSALESGRQPFVRSLVDLSRLVTACVEEYRSKARESGVSMEVASMPDEATVRGDSGLLKHALSNLIDNAIKYNREKGSVRVSLSKKGNTCLLRVIDTGIGIPKEDLPRIFERFYRVDKARSREMGGTGLGLAIVKHIVQAHNGSVSTESEVGKGSTFTLALPLIKR